MKIRQVYSGFAVAEQLQPQDIKAAAEEGFAAIICNRPDGEESGQPSVDDLRDVANEAGIAFHHIPVSGGPVSGGEFPVGAVRAFAAIRKGTQGSVLAFCRTGTRSITLEMLANPNDLAVSERLKRAEMAGYDLSKMSEKLA